MMKTGVTSAADREGSNSFHSKMHILPPVPLHSVLYMFNPFNVCLIIYNGLHYHSNRMPPAQLIAVPVTLAVKECYNFRG